MSEQRDWPDYAVQGWIRMQHLNAIADAEMDEDLRRVTDEQIREYEKSTALKTALEAWRMKD